MTRRTLFITYIATYLLAIAAVIRTLAAFQDERFMMLVALVTAYLILLFLEPFYIRRDRRLTYLYLVIETTIICIIALLTPIVDFWASLFVPLVVQVMHNFRQSTGLVITVVFTLLMSIFMIMGFGTEVAWPLILVYVPRWYNAYL